MARSENGVDHLDNKMVTVEGGLCQIVKYRQINGTNANQALFS